MDASLLDRIHSNGNARLETSFHENEKKETSQIPDKAANRCLR